ncbi:MAG: Fe-S cluster assembly protein SufD [Proteobacteria bacterium]|nr:Fe-S cluster assembly protein SufD [Pseudomonadota bacterium]MDA1064371.1 Fe-S cluster assembly protein SufD [Pseudomonadota bacterium]
MKPLLSIDAVRTAVQQLPDNGLAAARLAALTRLDADGLPTATHEDWKYTDLTRIVDVSNRWLAAGATTMPVADAAVAAITDQFAASWLVIRNGMVDARSIAKFAQSDVRIDLLSASDKALECDAPLSGLNVALLQDGLAIRIPANIEHAGTVGLLFIDHAAADVGVSQARIVIELEGGSAADFIEYHSSTGDAAHYANTVIELRLADGARCNYVRVQDRQAGHDQTGRLTATLGADSRLQHAAFDLGGNLVRNDLDIKLVGRGSATSFSGLYLAGREQHVDNHTRVDHLVGPTHSEQEYRGIAADAARCVWNGKAVVHRGADGTNARQANHNLLLSAAAEIDAKPELEIYADDVKASHGTTIGELDQGALFYLRTRGLDEAAARCLLMRAFAEKIVVRSPLPAIRQTISEKVAERVAALIVGDAK